MSDLKTPTREPDNTNERGNLIWRAGPFCNAERYQFDFDLCESGNGWKQYDTENDASYFGVWVHLERRLVVTFCEGDVTILRAPDNDHLRAELAAMGEFYGEAPPAFVVFDQDGTRTNVYDPRPEVVS